VLKKASRKSDVGQPNERESRGHNWDFAIAVRPGLHVTVFTSRSLLVGAAILVIAAFVAVVVMTR
jgi:hypothetical protein